MAVLLIEEARTTIMPALQHVQQNIAASDAGSVFLNGYRN